MSLGTVKRLADENAAGGGASCIVTDDVALGPQVSNNGVTYSPSGGVTSKDSAVITVTNASNTVVIIAVTNGHKSTGANWTTTLKIKEGAVELATEGRTTTFQGCIAQVLVHTIANESIGAHTYTALPSGGGGMKASIVVVLVE